LEDCQIRLNGQLFGQRYECPWDGKFVFLHCGQRNLDPSLNYWGGIRIANSEFEHYLYEYRIHDVVTHETVRRVESVLKFVNITGTGILHNERSAAIQSIIKSPSVTRVNIDRSAYHGINIISPTHTVMAILIPLIDPHTMRHSQTSSMLLDLHHTLHNSQHISFYFSGLYHRTIGIDKTSVSV
jgi:hypothetical protein